MKNKEIFSKLQKHKERIIRQIEYRRLKRVRRKKTPQYTYCKNCGTKLDGMYCYQCGQYALDIEQPFWKYILQYFENVYQFDSKIWLTLYYLFTRPGFLTREFNAGKINSYVHPLRLFMFLSCLFFLFFFALIPSSLDSINWSVEGEVGESAEISAEDVVLQMDLSKDVIDFWYDDLNEKEREAAVDTTIYFCGDSIMQKMLRRMSEQLPSDSEDTLRFSVPKILIEEGYLLPITAQDSVYALAEDDTYFGSEPDEVKKRTEKDRDRDELRGFCLVVLDLSAHYPAVADSGFRLFTETVLPERKDALHEALCLCPAFTFGAFAAGGGESVVGILCQDTLYEGSFTGFDEPVPVVYVDRHLSGL